MEGIVKKIVMKIGRIMNKKYGYFMGIVDLFLMEYFIFFDIYYFLGRFYIVEKIFKKCCFFMLGDFGFGVFVVEEN